jgi:hypothetical protein
MWRFSLSRLHLKPFYTSSCASLFLSTSLPFPPTPIPKPSLHFRPKPGNHIKPPHQGLYRHPNPDPRVLSKKRRRAMTSGGKHRKRATHGSGAIKCTDQEVRNVHQPCSPACWKPEVNRESKEMGKSWSYTQKSDFSRCYLWVARSVVGLTRCMPIQSLG